MSAPQCPGLRPQLGTLAWLGGHEGGKVISDCSLDFGHNIGVDGHATSWNWEDLQTGDTVGFSESCENNNPG